MKKNSENVNTSVNENRFYEFENKQLFVDAFNAFYEIAVELIYGEYGKRFHGTIECTIDERKKIDRAESYHDRLMGQLDSLGVEARQLRIDIFDTTKH